MATYFASERAVDVANEAVQIHGGYGYTTDFDVECYHRDAKVTTIFGGSPRSRRRSSPGT